MQAGAGPLRVAVVNDFELVVAGVAALLSRFPERVRLVELVSGLPVLEEADVVLYDTFGQLQGEALDVEALVGTSGARLVVYTWNLQPLLVEATVRAGASGYVSKAVSAQELVSSLERVHAGQTPVPSRPGTSVAAGRGEGDWPGRAAGLSVRESEIVALITRGLSNQEIAARSYLSINSVKTYIRSAYRKMGVASRSQAVLWGVRNEMQPDVVRRVVPDPGPA